MNWEREITKNKRGTGARHLLRGVRDARMSHVSHKDDVFVVVFGALAFEQRGAAPAQEVDEEAEHCPEEDEAHGNSVEKIPKRGGIVKPAVSRGTAVHVPHGTSTVHDGAVDERVRYEPCPEVKQTIRRSSLMREIIGWFDSIVGLQFARELELCYIGFKVSNAKEKKNEGSKIIFQ